MDAVEGMVRKALVDPPVASGLPEQDWGRLRRRAHAYRWRRRLVAGAVTLVVAGGVSGASVQLYSVSHPGKSLPAVLPPADSGPPLSPPLFLPSESALESWRSFPTGQVPRPVVLLDPLPTIVGSPDEQSKRAIEERQYDLAVTLPATVPEARTVTLPGGTARVDLVGAPQAYQAMASAGGSPGPAVAGNRLRIVEAILTTMVLRTDRGPVTVPAWSFTNDSGTGIAWPAVASGVFWRLGDLRGAAQIAEATVDATGQQLSVEMPTPLDPCPGYQRATAEAVVIESATAVAVGLRVTEPPGGTGTCRQFAVPRSQVYEVRLAAPLGARVLVDPAGAPVVVRAGA